MKKLNKGFTLVELLIAISIIGIMLALATPSFGRHRINSRTKDTAYDIYNLLQQAKIIAIKEGAPVRVIFDNAISDVVEFSTVTMRPSNGIVRARVLVLDEIQTSQSIQQTVFNSRGRVNTGTRGTWMISNKSTGYGYTVAVNIIGNITITPTAVN